MNYQVALAPNLHINAGKFVAMWNEQPDCKEVAMAHMQPSSNKPLDPTLGEVLTLEVLPIARNIAASALHGLIQDILVKQGVRQHTRIIDQKQPDGSEMLIVSVGEGT